MSRVLIAGGAGFLGSHLTDALIEKGYEVVVLDNLSSGLRTNLSSVESRIEFFNDDVAKFDYPKRLDVIVNLASRASRMEWETFPVEVALTNSIGNNNLIKLAIRKEALYLYASSSEVYGKAKVIPTPEEYIGKTSTVGSRSPYDEGKRFGETLVKAYERELGLRGIIMRIFNTYGPRMRGGDTYGRVIDRFIMQALEGKAITVYGDGSQTRSFTYVSDTVGAILSLIENGSEGEIYNIGNDEEKKIIEVANLVKSISYSKSSIKYLPLPPDDPSRRSADASKLRKLGWSPKIDLENGIRRTLNYYAETLNIADHFMRKG